MAQYGGGFVGCSLQGSVSFTDCLNSGEIICTYNSGGNMVGGFVGGTMANPAITMDNCLSTGKITDTAGTYFRVGSLVGYFPTGGTLNVNEESFGISKGATKTVGEGTTNSSLYQLDEVYLTGKNAYAWTTLDFSETWALRAGKTPVLSHFAAGDMTVAELKAAGIEQADRTWYKNGETSIDTAGELQGFALASLNDGFSGKTITLATDVALNGVSATGTEAESTWGTTVPDIMWLPIGSSIRNFLGSFDGNSYTVSGLYLKTDDAGIGMFGIAQAASTISDFKLKNSYFESTLASGLPNLGSVVGQTFGHVNHIYSNATIVAAAGDTGGIIGNLNGSELTHNITNCWYDGQLTANGQRIGGIVGNMVQGTLNVNNCMFSGDITSNYVDSGTSTSGGRVGGLIGIIQNTSVVTVEHSLAAGSIHDDNDGHTVGSIIGYISGDATDMTKSPSVKVQATTYGTAECSSKLVGAYRTYDADEETGLTHNHTLLGQIATEDDRFIGYLTKHHEGQIGEEVVDKGLWYNNAEVWTLRKNDTPALAEFVDDVDEYTFVDTDLCLATLGADISLSDDAIDYGSGNYVITISNAEVAVRNAYVSALGSNGFTHKVSNTSLADYGVWNGMLTKEAEGINWCVNITWVANTKKMYISICTGKPADELSDYLVQTSGEAVESTHTHSDGYTESISDMTLHMNELYNFGNSFVFQLKNGHFVVNDGGTSYELPYLIDYLESLSDGKNRLLRHGRFLMYIQIM